jgi:aminocarboxymuconate-semialdehyde decarboxylase
MAPDVIDAFAHVLPREFYDAMVDAHPTEELEALGDAPRFWDMSIRLELFETYGIDRQVVTLARPPIWRGMDPAEARPLVELANDAVRELADEHEELVPVATLPFVAEGAVSELERCLDMGMAGVQLFSNVEGRPIDSEAHRAVYAAAEAAGAPVWLHPQLHDWHGWDDEYMLHKILGWPFDTSMALARLVFGGVVADYPDLTVIPHHMGAMIPHFASRLELFHEMLVQHRDVYPYEVRDLRGRVREQFSRFYGDSCRCGDPGVLEDGLDFFGEDRLVFATDYPFGPDEGERFIADEVAAVEGMAVDDATRADVFGGNLQRLLS